MASIFKSSDKKQKKSNNDLIIFKTHADKYSNDITKMSNFFDEYLEQMEQTLRERTQWEIVRNIPFSDISILCEVIEQTKIISQGTITFIPDLKNIPKDIRNKLKKGLYKIGKSKQVDGNFRAVIVDENNTRVKDITLKKSINTIDNIETIENISTQLQLRQIYTQLNELQEFQNYQLEIAKNQAFIVPFLNARDLLLESETKNGNEEKIKLIKNADRQIMNALNAIYADIQTTSNSFANSIDSMMKISNKNINKYMDFLIRDLQIAIKYNGVRLQVLDYIGEDEIKKQVLERLKNVLRVFISAPISKKGLSTIELLQNYYPYNKVNMNFWNDFSEKIKPKLKDSVDLSMLNIFQNKKNSLYSVSVEDIGLK